MKSMFVYSNLKRNILRQSYLWRQFDLIIELVRLAVG